MIHLCQSDTVRGGVGQRTRYARPQNPFTSPAVQPRTLRSVAGGHRPLYSLSPLRDAHHRHMDWLVSPSTGPAKQRSLFLPDATCGQSSCHVALKHMWTNQREEGTVSPTEHDRSPRDLDYSFTPCQISYRMIYLVILNNAEMFATGRSFQPLLKRTKN